MIVTHKTFKHLHIITTHDIITKTSNLVLMVAHKRQVQVTLDVECYDDLDLENLDWNTLLDLEGDEKVHYVKIKEHEVFC